MRFLSRQIRRPRRVPVAPVLFAPRRTSAPPKPGVVIPVAPAGSSLRKRQDLASSWGTPIVRSHMFSRRRQDCGHQTIAVAQRGPRYHKSEGSRERSFDAQEHGFRTGCLRFAERVARAPRQTRFRPLVRRYRAGFPPAGFHRKVSELLHLIPLSQASWRNPKHRSRFE